MHARRPALLALTVATAVAALAQAPATSHSPTGPAPATPVAPAAHAAAAPSGAPSLVWTKPAAWADVPPSSPMRKAQYKVPGAAGEAECAVFYFGAGQGGDPAANAQRWASQFTPPAGVKAEDNLKTSTIDVGGIKVTMVEVKGTYSGGGMMGQPSTPLANAMLLGAIAEGPDANWFFKLTGPEKTVADARAAFDGMIKSLKRAGT